MNQKQPGVRHRILLIGLLYFENLGDPLYMMTTRRLLEERGYTVDLADLYGQTELKPRQSKQMPDKPRIHKRIRRCVVRTVFRLWPISAYRFKKHWSNLYFHLFQKYDAVIVPGGGVISLKPYPFHRYFRLMQEQCARLRIPFCMNAVGITKICGAQPKHTYAWRHIINSPSMTYFACRDGSTILNRICRRELPVAACTATLSDRLFDINRDANANTVGIGVIKGDAFSEYGHDFSEEQLVEFYSSLVTATQKRGYRVRLFVNGFQVDRDIATKVQQRLNDDALLLPCAESPEELVRQIASFRAVMCARMHAAIIAFALNIPTVLFCWGVKGRDFMEMANAADFAVPPERMRADVVLPLLERAMNEGWDAERRAAVRRSAEESIDRMLQKINEYNRG